MKSRYLDFDREDEEDLSLELPRSSVGPRTSWMASRWALYITACRSAPE
mgnify:CR=1 FL=1